jgi:hypothetical protein
LRDQLTKLQTHEAELKHKLAAAHATHPILACWTS